MTASLHSASKKKIVLPSLFSSGIVFQRNRPIKVWGEGPDGTEICVQLADHKASANVANGRWIVTLPSLPAGGPHIMTIHCGEDQHVVENILVGEVFLCAGQSNMECTVSSLSTREEMMPRTANQNLRLFLQTSPPALVPNQDCVNGRWAACIPDHAPDLPALPLIFGMRLQEKLGIPVGILVAAVGGTGILSWLAPSFFDQHDDLRELYHTYPWERENYDAIYAQWQNDRRGHEQENTRLLAAGKEALPWTKYLFFGPRGPKCLAQPSGFYHGMICPLAPFAVRAVLWYQGETDAEIPQHYARNLRELVERWRMLWQEPGMPFLIVQIVKWTDDGISLNWPFIRESQIKVSDEVNFVTVVPGVDLGDPKDVHPGDKELMAERLARFALPAINGQPVPESPRIIKVNSEKEAGLTVTFSRPVRATGPTICGFEIAGANGEFHEATARLLTPRTAWVEFNLPKDTPSPALRYLWQGAPEPCLFSEEGLPVLPFRTDTAPPPYTMDTHYCSAWPDGVSVK